MPLRAFQSPLGALTVRSSDDGAITGLDWQGSTAHSDAPELVAAEAQLNEYFAGTRQSFTLPLSPGGSRFQRDICAAMSAIPYGETRTYGDLARLLDVTPQAVGQGCGGNPIPILIPCHRVLAADGLGGYSGAGGIETKVALLRLEGAASLLL